MPFSFLKNSWLNPNNSVVTTPAPSLGAVGNYIQNAIGVNTAPGGPTGIFNRMGAYFQNALLGKNTSGPVPEHVPEMPPQAHLPGEAQGDAPLLAGK